MNQTNRYNEEPVYYCPRCLSIKIKADIADYCYCEDCGSTRIDTADIFEWEKMYKQRYGIRYLNR